MTTPRRVEIVGGGLAGLALGLALRRAELPVVLFEAGDYPRHRVCGEFITGLGQETISQLGLETHLRDVELHKEVTWYLPGQAPRRQHLPEPARAISRHALDARLAAAFVEHGGQLFTRTRIDLADTPAGRVFAAGRRRVRSSWLGLKVHARGIALRSELELHLGDRAYVGLCRVEDDRVNVCGLFRQRAGLAGGREQTLIAHLRASGLGALAERLSAAELDADSFSAVAGLGFQLPRGDPQRIQLGDAFAMIPPFTGNGMAMAFESAECAVSPLVRWARGEADWTATTAEIRRRLRARFRVRLLSAAALHPFLLKPARQRWIALANRLGILPLRPLYHLLH